MKLRLLLVSLIVMLAFACGSVSAEDNRAMELRFHLGKAAFLDESTPFDHTAFAASVRIFLSERFAIEPEFTYLHGPGSDRDYLFVSNAVYEFVRGQKASAYLIGGVGLIHHREQFPGAADPDFSDNGLTATGGIGVNVELTERIVFCPEFRFGWDPLYRFTAGIAYRF